MRVRHWLGALALAVVCLMIGWVLGRRPNAVTEPEPSREQQQAGNDSPAQSGPDQSSPGQSTPATALYAHNLRLRKGPDFQIYIQWVRGQFIKTNPRVNASFDKPESFYIDIANGVVRANLGDLGNFLNSDIRDSPVRNIKITGNGDQIRLNGTLHKGIPIPIQLDGLLSATPDGQVHVHVKHFGALKIPLKGLLGLFRISLADLFKAKIDGLVVAGDDLYFDTLKLLPPPHIRGHLTQVHIANPDLEEVFGDAREDVERVEQWRNFLRLKGGKIDFGKVTMNDVDLMMIDISKDPWFDLDLINYKAQLTSSYSRVTSDFAVQIFMPDRRDLPPSSGKQDDSIAWFKNRNIPPPPQIMSQVAKKQ